MNRSIRIALKHLAPWSAAAVLLGCSQSQTAAPSAKAAEKAPAAAQPAAKLAAAEVPATRPFAKQTFGKGSWYISINTTPSNWSKTGLFYEKEWADHVDVGDNTTLELYVKALTPHTIEVFNNRKLAIGLLAHTDAAHPNPTPGVTLGDYVQLKDQNWTKISIPLSDFKGLNPHDIFFIPGLPISLGSGDYQLGVDEVRFVGGTKPFVFYGDAHPNNPIAIHGVGMDAHYIAAGGVEVSELAVKK